MEKNEERTISIEMQVDLHTHKVIGALPNKEKIQSEEQLDIVTGIINRLQNLFNSDGSDWVNDYLNHVEKVEYIEAYNLLVNKYIFLKQPINISLFNSLLKLDYRKLPAENQYTYLVHIIALGYIGKFYKEIEPLLDILEKDFQEIIDKETQGRIYLTKSDIYIKSEKRLSANRLLNIVINDSEYPDNIRAYAYRQLAWLSPLEKDKLIYFEHAHDLFIISGKMREAIEELINAYNILLSKSPVAALNKIDLAIQLLETESYIDKETSAWLYRKKAYVLFIRKRYGESFTEIQKAINLQQDLIGNESSKYATLKFAEELMRIMDNTEKQNELSKITSSLKNTLQNNDYMDIQFALEESLKSEQIICDEQKEKIFNKGDKEQQFDFYLISALNKNIPFEEKLHLLDMALKTEENLMHDTDNKYLIYNAIAEIYREHGDITIAIDWFEKTFSIAPFNMGALQNYIHLLWSNNLWEQLENVCKRYIDIAGYAPNLYFIYGKALQNQSKYNEALLSFKRCKRDLNFSIEKEIMFCFENIGESDLDIKSLLSEKRKISINEFINAAKDVTDSISQRSRMHLWKYNKMNKSYRWKSNPEAEVKNLFIQGIVQIFSRSDFEIIEEVKTSAGRIDLYVIIGSDLKIIIELKMCGGGYSSNYAIDGENQLINYLESKNLSFGVLIVFDGRIRDFSKGISSVISKNNKLIHTIVVDMRPKLE